jgi:hypothetical protein
MNRIEAVAGRTKNFLCKNRGETGPALQVITPVADAGTDAKAIAVTAASESEVNKRIFMLL